VHIGRDSYKFVNLKARLLSGKIGKRDAWQEVAVADAARSAGLKLRDAAAKGGDKRRFVLTGNTQ